MKELLIKYKDIIYYGIFGLLTTVVNIFTYWLLARILHVGVMPSTIVAWVVAVVFAYLTNRKFVFHSSAETVGEVTKEILSFFACRLTTGFVDWGCMFVFVDILGWNDLIIKTAANILVIILNYIASKLIIFKKK